VQHDAPPAMTATRLPSAMPFAFESSGSATFQNRW
jgi:hypothetical protein